MMLITNLVGNLLMFLNQKMVRKLLPCLVLLFTSNAYAALDGLSDNSTTAVLQLLFLLAMVIAPFWLVGAILVWLVASSTKEKPQLLDQLEHHPNRNKAQNMGVSSKHRLVLVGRSYFFASLFLLLINILPFFNLGQMPRIAEVANNMTRSSIFPNAGLFQLLILFSFIAGFVFYFFNPKSTKVREALYLFGFALMCFAAYSMQSRVPAVVLLMPLVVGFIQK
jgi:hypothetical protein